MHEGGVIRGRNISFSGKNAFPNIEVEPTHLATIHSRHESEMSEIEEQKDASIEHVVADKPKKKRNRGIRKNRDVQAQAKGKRIFRLLKAKKEIVMTIARKK